MIRAFRVIAISTNTNSFGLRGVIVISSTGEAWELCANDLHTPNHGAELTPEVVDGVPQWGRLGFETPKRLQMDPFTLVGSILSANSRRSSIDHEVM